MKRVERSLAVRTGVGLTANVVQHSALRISAVAVDHAALILLKHGVKTVRSGSRQWTARDGDAIVVAGGQTLDIRNELSAQGLYEARWVVWDPGLLDVPQRVGSSPAALVGAAVLPAVGAEFSSVVERAVRAIDGDADVPEPVACHRLGELLVWLREAGIALNSRPPSTLAARLRAVVTPSIAADWTLSDAARRLATSPATLRRKLAAEGTTFGRVLADTRMAHAMTLVQTTERAIQHIASDVGYDSPSRFAVRFRARFGVAPSALRGHQR
jgi:AraC-like DNA-binding protein